jgi:polar amino acid transport system substrate-binding protein
MTVTPSAAVVAELAPSGALRAGINLSNFLLVTGRAPNGDPQGVAPDMAAEIAARLDVPLKLRPYPNPGKLADAVAEWDVGLIGAEPARAQQIAFSAAYLEIESTYLVPPGSKIRSIEDVDRKGVRIAVYGKSAYGLYLARSIKNAELVNAEGLDASWELFVKHKLDALAGLRPRLVTDVDKLPGARVLDGRFTAVQQAVGTPRARSAGAAFLAAFVEEAKASGLVARLIERHGVRGVNVAPAAQASSS